MTHPTVNSVVTHASRDISEDNIFSDGCSVTVTGSPSLPALALTPV